MILFGHSTQDFIPVMSGKYKPQQAWIDNNNLCELALRKRHMQATERLDEHTNLAPASSACWRSCENTKLNWTSSK